MPAQTWHLRLAAVGVCLVLSACSDSLYQRSTSRYPPLASLPRAASAPADLSQDGAEYDDSLPHANVTRQDSSAVYTPGGGGPWEMAFATYRFDLAGLSGPQKLNFAWTGVPAPGTLYAGLANWSEDRWDFFLVPDSLSLSVDDIAAYVRDDDVAYVVVIANAPGSYELDRLYFPGPPVPPLIESVSPVTAQTGATVAFNAAVTGSEPLSFSWSFGGGCTPDTSTEASPEVLAGATGQYSCSLQVDNPHGSDTYEFTLLVSEPFNGWIHTMGGSGSDSGFLCDVDAAGNLYATSLSSIFVKYNPGGERQWYRVWGFDKTISLEGFACDSDGSLYASGSYDYTYPEGEAGFIARLDNAGNLIWARTWDGPDGEWRPATGGGLAIDGDALYVTMNYQDMDYVYGAALLKFDKNGNLLSQVAWNNGEFDYAHFVDTDAGGNVYVGGRVSHHPPLSGVEGLLMKYDAGGNLVFSKLLGNGTQVRNLRCLSDGSPMVVLTSGAIRLQKFTTEGNLVWAWRYLHNASCGCNEFYEMPDGDLYLVGTHRDDLLHAKNEIHLLHVLSNGSLDWTRAWLGYEADHEYMHALRPAPGGGIYMVGSAYSTTGTWINVTRITAADPYSPVITDVVGNTFNPQGSVEDITAEATEFPWNFVDDVGGGKTDMLLMRYEP